MKIGIIGIGVVGEELLDILSCEKLKLEKLLDEKIDIIKICNRTFKKKYKRYSYTSNYVEILEDKSIDTVIELIGGIDTAFDIAKKTLTLKKNLITANKHLLAIHGKELFQLAKENNVKIFFEASVGGGIPILSPLKEGLFPNEFISIRGILNGTANYVLTQMGKGAEFLEGIEDAQKKGYAEMDPTFDIEGIDTAHKISLLTYLAWGKFINFNDIEVIGISNLKKQDIEDARRNNQKYKLLGEATFLDGRLNLSVKPVLINKDELLYSVDGIYNAVEIKGKYTGTTIFYGEGAGGKATASAVISDLYKICRCKSWQY